MSLTQSKDSDADRALRVRPVPSPSAAFPPSEPCASPRKGDVDQTTRRICAGPPRDMGGVPGATGIVLIDDDWVALSRLREFIEQSSEFLVVAACRCADGAMLAVKQYRPAAMILDVRLPDRGGVELIRDIVAISTAKVIVYTTALHKEEILNLLRNGAKAVVLKDQPMSVLVSCVRKVLAAEHLSQDVTTEDVANGGCRAGVVLSPREQEIADWVLAGARNKEIAWQLGISEGTVKHQLFSIYRKLKVGSRIELMLTLRRTIAIGCITLVGNQSLIA